MCVVLNTIYQNLQDIQFGLEICLAPFANDCLFSEAMTLHI
jgi:hypothetical protein